MEMNQVILDDIANTLDVKYQVLDNLKDGKKIYRASITLTNNSDHALKYGKWGIYFCHIRMLEPSALPGRDGCEMDKFGIKFIHINGCLFKICPMKNFKTLNKGDSLEIKFKAQYFSVARSDLMPNWYLLHPKLKPCLIKSTVGEEMKFVQPFDTPEKWKRFDYVLDSGAKRYDRYNPYNMQERFDRNKCGDVKSLKPVIPTPVYAEMKEATVEIKDWVIVAREELFNEASYLAGKQSLKILQTKDIPKQHCIILDINSIGFKGSSPKETTNEAYLLTIPKEGNITITGSDKAGVFYGIQALISLTKNNKAPVCYIEDAPRYSYRGMHMDVSRNFHSKEQILKLLDVMAMYKMNKFHFHLTDDEGWRLEIPGLPELTEVGARRGHVNNTEISCLLPLLGSGPDFSSSGTGYYSVDDYKEILRFAKARHIEVIPEVDMPGHSHAAIQAMKSRYQNYKDSKQKKKAEEYMLIDLDDVSVGRSVQMFADNSMNPGLESTYAFVKKIVQEVKKLHEDISPLKTFHFGGDEVPYESWEGSPACMALIDSEEVKSSEHLMEYFVTRVADIVAENDLNLGAWQDGVITDEITLTPVRRSKFKNKEVLAYAWQNVWESGLSGCAYKLANAGYKVIMSQGTHLYFDHPYEPDPEERGLYWACRFLDTRKAFMFMPDNVYGNADVKLTGEAVPEDYIEKHKEDHDDLKKPENVIGVQGQLWTELVRTPDQMDFMIFPRLLCVAERGWHKALWEDEEDGDKRKDGQDADWDVFAHTLGKKELARLDKMGVSYRVPPPGACCSTEDGKLGLNCAYPGLPMFYSTDKEKTWTKYTGKMDLSPDTDMHFCTRSADGKRSSRVVVMKKPEV